MASHGVGFCVHGPCVIPERRYHERLVRIELLPHGSAHGRWTVVCIYRFGLNDYPTGDFLRGIIEAAVDYDLFCLLSYRPAVRRQSRRDTHGPFPRRAREGALEPPRPARAARKLDHRWPCPRAYGGTFLEIVRLAGSDGPSDW